MSAKKTSVPRQPDDAQAAWDLMADLGRQQMAFTTEAACAAFRSFEGATRYWQQLGAVALQMQTEMIGCYGKLATPNAVLASAHILD